MNKTFRSTTTAQPVSKQTLHCLRCLRSMGAGSRSAWLKGTSGVERRGTASVVYPVGNLNSCLRYRYGRYGEFVKFSIRPGQEGHRNGTHA